MSRAGTSQSNYRSADDHFDRLPALAAELVPVAVIAAVGATATALCHEGL
jgi:phosphoglycerate-specific signal transduction histidine kinase